MSVHTTKLSNKKYIFYIYFKNDALINHEKMFSSDVASTSYDASRVSTDEHLN